ncbi:MAG TPA: DUF721 domain-containing protein [Gemmatimonadaceae bacterium]|jgi:predicted nucleic acid-binding Zn ribbon protein
MSPPPRRGPPQPLRDALAGFLRRAGLTERIEQASIIPEWAALVGEQIASVTTAQMVTRDGTLFVDVTTNAWMQELSLMEPQLLKALNSRPGGSTIQRLRWRLKRP